MSVIRNKRFDFTKKNKRTGKTEKVGYLEIKDEDDKATLYFYGDIVSTTWESTWCEENKCPQDIADFLNSIDGKKDITIYFNSGGGDVFAGIAIYNQLKRHEGRKVGYVDALAASIASAIMFVCDELYFASGAQCMIHKPLCIARGNANDFRNVIEQLDKCEESILDIYEEHLKEGVTRDEIKSLMNVEKWFSGNELAEYFDVQIEEKTAVAACTSLFFDEYKNVPDSLTSSVKDITDAVITELQNREAAKNEAERESILGDLCLYGT